MEIIDAEVTSLSSEIPLSADMTTADLRSALIDYEKKLFYEKTDFGKLTGCEDLNFSDTGRYDVIYNHILVHKYYLNERVHGEIPFSQALVSWYHEVYEPIIAIIREEYLYLNFSGRTPSDLYVWIVKHREDIKKNYGLYSLPMAALDFSQKYGKNEKGFKRFLAIIFDRLFNKPAKGGK
jgi:hypothetical protein